MLKVESLPLSKIGSWTKDSAQNNKNQATPKAEGTSALTEKQIVAFVLDALPPQIANLFNQLGVDKSSCKAGHLFSVIPGQLDPSFTPFVPFKGGWSGPDVAPQNYSEEKHFCLQWRIGNKFLYVLPVNHTEQLMSWTLRKTRVEVPVLLTAVQDESLNRYFINDHMLEMLPNFWK